MQEKPSLHVWTSWKFVSWFCVTFSSNNMILCCFYLDTDSIWMEASERQRSGYQISVLWLSIPLLPGFLAYGKEIVNGRSLKQDRIWPCVNCYGVVDPNITKLDHLDICVSKNRFYNVNKFPGNISTPKRSWNWYGNALVGVFFFPNQNFKQFFVKYLRNNTNITKHWSWVNLWN